MSEHGRKPKILYLVTEDWYFVSHRLGLARAVRDTGAEVVVVTRTRDHAQAIKSEGFRLVWFLLPRSKFSIVSELKSVINLIRIYRKERPDLVHHVALKPSLYGSLAALFVPKAAVVNAVTGLGYVFTPGSWAGKALQPLVSIIGRMLLGRGKSCTIVQNPDDFETLSRVGVIGSARTVLIAGSGVDLQAFAVMPEPSGVPTVAIVSRMLWNKGVGELVEAARLLRGRGKRVRVLLVGTPDPENPSSIPERQLCEWHDDGLVQWQGYRNDIAAVWREAHIAVLPSYREGLPKSLLEAAACGRPIVATNVPGCREIVESGRNGLLVPRADGVALANAIEALLDNPELRKRMGSESRRLVETHFGQDVIVGETLKVYDTLLDGGYGTAESGAAAAA